MTDSFLDRRLLLQAAAFSPALAAVAAGAAQAATGGDPLIVIAEIVAKPGAADGMRDVLTTLAAAARHEPGNRHYTLMEDREAPGRFLTYEMWDDKAALDGHMKGPGIAAATPKVVDLIAKPPTQALLKTLSTS